MQPLSFPINAAQDQVFAQQLLAAQLPHRSRAFKIFPRRWMGGGGPAGHAIAVNVFRLTWLTAILLAGVVSAKNPRRPEEWW